VADHRVLIVGAGFSGIGAAMRLRRAGIDDFVVLERAKEIGGTWRDNVYPGCRCDVPSSVYSFSFGPPWDWSRTYGSGPEIHEYLGGCIRRDRLEPHLSLGEAVRELHWEEEAGHWRVETDRGVRTARVVVMATGALSEPAVPRLAGIRSFSGRAFHSSRWEDAVALDGARVAVVGSGASAVQIVPAIAPVVDELHVYQRTPPWVLPRAERRLSALERGLYARLPALARATRSGAYWRRELLFPAFRHRPIGRVVERLALAHLRSQVADPALRLALRPDYRIGCKRILLSSDYYPALTRANTTLVPHAVREVTAGGIVAADGVERAVDVIVFATGFHLGAALPARRIHGRDGITLAGRWSTGPLALNGTTVTGFPNLVLLLGPHTGLGHNSVLVMLEAQIGYLLELLDALDRRGLRSLEPRAAAEASYGAWIRQRAERTVFERGGCRSWYLDDEGHSLLWPDFSYRFARRLRRFDIKQYEAHAA
jgi:cation diffusion facilitator CzcD-associated flavoprotein CzcO